MRKGEFLTQKCSCCGEEKRKSIDFFKKQNIKGQGFSLICRECEDEAEKAKDWKDGKLLCYICGEYLDEESFSKHPHYKYRNNREKRCPACKLKQIRTCRANYSEDRKLEKLLLHRFHGAKARAKEKNLPFDITHEFLQELYKKQNGRCAISNIEMTNEFDNGRTPFNISIDQINPNKGYVKDNIQLICMAVNQLKSDFEMDTILQICKSIINNVSH